ncbi:Xaa-Pro aminopeptidase [Chitinophaga eiseniae]|uniref:Xaa-Pro aminopeptidase n=1 Tax=Chitinophaga eiseniae TaxID=634771 RepID=A0A1T4Q8L1_9BACT|nr:aminopeptidase P N-terminal domain-containing protein [Chitinophaga eiseniae]SKA00140.1 Xaa-Pro aminopeptidase [Chitinophaga eiseniae]
MKNLPLDSQLFVKNRARFVAKMQPQSIAIINSNDELPTNGDALYKFKQNSDLYWLTGIDQEDTMLVLFPDNPDPKYREVLVLVRPNELKEKWDGHRLRKDEAFAVSGISTVVWLDSLDALLQQWVNDASNIYLNSNENNRKSSHIAVRDYRYAQEMKLRYPLHNYLRAAVIFKELRAVKTPEEVKVMQEAVDITEKAFRRVLKFIKPGVWEHEIQAEIVHEFLRNRSAGEAYGSIIASGDRARTLHYIYNNEECKDGELILMDFGAEYGGYNADLTRTVPVNGKFTDRQRQVYNACLHLHNYAKGILRPGITIAKYHEMVGVEAGKEFVKLGLLTEADIKNQDPESPAYRKYLYHGISHHLGVDVHDLGPSFHKPIPEGAVMTVEPGIYIEEEKMGIRIENNIWLTASGNVDLFKNIPVTAEEIEALMK